MSQTTNNDLRDEGHRLMDTRAADVRRSEPAIERAVDSVLSDRDQRNAETVRRLKAGNDALAAELAARDTMAQAYATSQVRREALGHAVRLHEKLGTDDVTAVLAWAEAIYAFLQGPAPAGRPDQSGGDGT